MTEADALSFDPRAWGVAASAPAPSTGPAPVDARADVPAHALRPARASRLALAIAASLAVTATGFVLAWINRVPPGPAQTGPALTGPGAVAGRAPVATGQAEPVARVILNLDGPAELEAALRANGLAAAPAQAAARAAAGMLAGRAEAVRVVIDLAGPPAARRLERLEASFIDSSGVVVTPAGNGAFQASAVAASLTTAVVDRRGEMNGADFYSSAVAAGVLDSLIQPIAKAFAFDFNFQTEIAKGDVFEVVYEQPVNAARQPVGSPRLLYAWISTPAKEKAVYRFRPPGRDEGWFDGYGRSVSGSLMRTPVDGAHITSHFGLRFHPTLHYTRLHGGTDFAAPVGTAVYAAAAATVLYAGTEPCGGNNIKLEHDNHWETRYRHLSRFEPGVVAGTRVVQGQKIGEVGTTGSCTTGPHLHYELLIGGEKVDPESIPTGQGEILTGDALKAFLKERDRIDAARQSRAAA